MIDLDGLVVDGVSVGGFASCLDLPEFKVCVDLGVLLERIVAREVVLITHAHADHLGAMVQHVAQRGLRGLRPATYIVPPGIEGAVEELLGVWRRLDRGVLRAVVRPVAPGEEFVLRRDLVVRPFQTKHRVASQGYIFENVRRRLRQEFKGRAGTEIAALRREGAEVDEVVHEPALAVTGDTSIEGLLGNPEALAAPRLVLEATFLDDRVSPEKAERLGHIHLEHIVEAADRFRCGALLLNHVSPRHSGAQARRLVQERLPADLARRTQVMVAGVEPGRE